MQVKYASYVIMQVEFTYDFNYFEFTKIYTNLL